MNNLFIVAATAITSVCSGKIIGSGNVLLGVTDYGNLGAPYVGGVLGLPANDPLGFSNFWLRNGGTQNAGFYSGIDYNKSLPTFFPGDGWQLVVEDRPESFPAFSCLNIPSLGAVDHLLLIESTGQSGCTNASSVVGCQTPKILVKHLFRPSAAADLMEIEISITNKFSRKFSFQYVRLVGWDIHPTRQSLLTHLGVEDTIKTRGALTELASIDGYDFVYNNQDATDFGPGNFSSSIGFHFNYIAPGQTVSFRMYYGLSSGMSAVNESLSQVKAEMAILAKPANSTDGLPYTYIMAFNDIAVPILTPSKFTFGNICFSGVNTVEERDSGTIPITEVKIGDFVKAGNGHYTQVYGFGHLDRDLEESFLQIHFTTSSEENKKAMPNLLEISSKHMVFVERNGRSIALKASDVSIGDSLSGRIVASFHTVLRQGVYAPLTMSGDIAVSGILSSNYVEVLDFRSGWYDHHTIGHAVWGPRRLFCRYFMDACKQETYYDGYNGLAIVFLNVALLLNNIGWFVNMIISCPW